MPFVKSLVTGAVMIIFDEEFFETNKAGLVFRDSKGSIIRASRIAKGEIDTLNISMTIKGNLDERGGGLKALLGTSTDQCSKNNKANSIPTLLLGPFMSQVRHVQRCNHGTRQADFIDRDSYILPQDDVFSGHG